MSKFPLLLAVNVDGGRLIVYRKGRHRISAAREDMEEGDRLLATQIAALGKVWCRSTAG